MNAIDNSSDNARQQSSGLETVQESYSSKKAAPQRHASQPRGPQTQRSLKLAIGKYKAKVILLY